MRIESLLLSEQWEAWDSSHGENLEPFFSLIESPLIATSCCFSLAAAKVLFQVIKDIILLEITT